MRSPRRKRIVGYTLVISGMAVNKWSLSPLATDGEVSSWNGILIVFLFQLPAILAGAISIFRADRRSIPLWMDFALLATAFGFALAISELALDRFAASPVFQPTPRAFVGEYENRESKHFVTDSATGWRMRPNNEFRWRIDGHWNQYRSNNQGFRSDVDFDRLESLHRIVVVGDSFAFGTGVDVEETFAALLDTRLGDDTAVCNLSMPGFGVDQMWMSVRHQAVPMKPALVIVAFIDDDLDRSLTAYRRKEGLNKPTFELEGGILRPQRAGDTPDPFTRYLERHSSLWAVVRSSVRALGFSFPIGDWWSRNEAIFRAILEDGRNAGIPILLVRLPSKNWREFSNLKSLAESEGADLLDLGSPRMGPSYPVHFPNDGHINKAGHAFVAGKIIDWLSERTTEATTSSS